MRLFERALDAAISAVVWIICSEPYWSTRKRRRAYAEVLANIAQIERELGIDSKSLLGAGPKKRELPHARDLSHVAAPRADLPIMLVNHKVDLTQELLYGPGAVIPINDGGKVEYFSEVSSSTVSARVVCVPKSRVLLPDGVHPH